MPSCPRGVVVLALAVLSIRMDRAATTPEERLCACSSRDTVLVLAGGALREWPGDLPIGLGDGVRPTVLACDGEQAAVGAVDAGSGKDGRIVLLTRGPAGWEAGGEIAVRGVPREIALSSGRLAVVLERGHAFFLAIMDASSGTKITQVPIAERPASLAVSPDGATFLIAAGRVVRSYRVADGRTWIIYPFAEPIIALTSKPGVPRVLVALGRSVIAADPKDRASRGVLPERARAELPGLPVALAWTGDGAVAAALVREPSALVFLNGEDLAILDQREIGAMAIAPRGAGRIAWLASNAEGEVWEASLDPRAIAAAVKPSAAPATAAPAPPRPMPPAPAPATPALTADAPPRAAADRAPAPTIDPPSAARAPGATTQPTSEPPSPAGAPGAPSNVPATTAPPPPASKPAPVSPRPRSPAPTPTPAAPTAGAALPKVADQAPAPTIDQPSAAKPPEAAAKPGSEPSTPAGAPAAPPTVSAAGAPTEESGSVSPTAGTIVGRIDGHPELVEQVLVLGPDSLVTERARSVPATSGGVVRFVATGLAPGRYRVIPMGRAGSSLAARPRFVTVTMSADAGARADFTIDGSL